MTQIRLTFSYFCHAQAWYKQQQTDPPFFMVLPFYLADSNPKSPQGYLISETIMTTDRALNLYAYLKQQNASPQLLASIVKTLQTEHQIDLTAHLKPKKARPSPNRFDINNYGVGGSRTLNQTRQMQNSESR